MRTYDAVRLMYRDVVTMADEALRIATQDWL